MLMVDGYIVNYNNRNWFYGIDEMREAMARATLFNCTLIRLTHETITGKRYYDSYDADCKCWVDEFDISKIYDVSDAVWDTHTNPTQSGWYLVTMKNDEGQRYVAPLYCMEYPSGNFHWEMNRMLGKVIAIQPFPSPYRG